jgi:biopolymer transport protein ExbD
MIDIVFLLLIFFIVTWNFARYETELDVTVPAAEEGQENQRDYRQVIINVRDDGTIVMNRQEMTPDELLVRMGELQQLYPDQPVILRGDQETPYKHIVKVLDVARKAGIWNIAFAVSTLEEQ